MNEKQVKNARNLARKGKIMLMQEAIRVLMKVKRMTQTQAAKYINLNQRAISRVINNNRLEVSQAIELLNFLGYELIVREKTGGPRRDDEIIINNVPEFAGRKEEKKVVTAVNAVEAERIKKFLEEDTGVRFSSRERIMLGCNGAEIIGIARAADIVGVSYRTMMKKYGQYFENHKITAEKLIEVMDSTSISCLNEKIREMKNNNPNFDYNAAKKDMIKRINAICPNKLVLSYSDIARLTGYSQPYAVTTYKKYFSENAITINDFLNAFILEGGKTK